MSNYLIRLLQILHSIILILYIAGSKQFGGSGFRAWKIAMSIALYGTENGTVIFFFLYIIFETYIFSTFTWFKILSIFELSYLFHTSSKLAGFFPAYSTQC